ncbi:MAG: NifU family protein [Aquificaceae bacterium]|nr:NifU family protein [Aquificaceae bacterium]MCX7989508.1 NifU family protein [Aquificaceae bacterium]MDW8032638.1 NifU family protein [Aquificaceae bacterium]MDW8294480.1 NifU family protein [Aquificaceae bacterium]
MEEREFREVEEILERIRPALKEHQGDLKVVDIREGEVYLQFEGGCTDCPIADVSVKNVVDMAIKGNLSWVKKVEILQPRYHLG